MRKIIIASIWLGLLLPVITMALGLGEIKVYSTLNEALNAEIPLRSITKKDLESLNVNLASKEDYNRAKINRSDYLSEFKFDVIQRGKNHYVTITTRKPFKEPYVNFLIEVTWGSGRILSEYTMLIDPPEIVKDNSSRL